MLQVIPSRIEGEVKVSGVLGAAAPLDKKGPAVGDQAVGMGGTTAWKLASLVILPAIYSCQSTLASCHISNHVLL